MAFGITLCLDPAAAARIEAWWRALADASFSRSMLALGYGPHITLGVYDDLEADAVIPVLDRIVAGRPPPSLRLSGLGVFPADPSVLWAVPAASPELLQLHGALHDALACPCQAHYLPGRWVPHCSLATDLADPGAALESLSGDFQPIEARLEILDLVRFPPVESLWQARFIG